METTKEVIKNIALCGVSFKKKLSNDCIKHRTAQCNGDYYFDEEKEEWTDILGKKMENGIVKRILKMTKTKEMPNFLTYEGDPRGLTIYLDCNRLDKEEIETCRHFHLDMDFGGNYSILIIK